MDAGELRFDEHGAARHDGAALSILAKLEAAVARCPAERPGVRLRGHPTLAGLLAPDSSIGRIAANRIGSSAHPVRAVLFDKTPGTNWALGWHQDRTIAVSERQDVPGYGPWSIKSGIVHVEPPFKVIEAMVTLRVHLDDVPADNAPLLVVPGSHRLGKVAEAAIGEAAVRCGTAVCIARRGDIWGYSTPVIHASSASSGHAHRRVLQVDYSTIQLPAPLAWLGVG